MNQIFELPVQFPVCSTRLLVNAEVSKGSHRLERRKHHVYPTAFSIKKVDTMLRKPSTSIETFLIFVLREQVMVVKVVLKLLQTLQRNSSLG